MRTRIRESVLDEMIDCYVDWRQESEQVESAYRRWAIAPSPHTSRAFAAYAAALDREELASISYAQVIRRTAVVFERDRRRRFAVGQRRVTRRRPTRSRRRNGPRPRRAGPRARATRGDRSVRSGGRGRSGRRAG
jgi:hypothetical protein